MKTMTEKEIRAAAEARLKELDTERERLQRMLTGGSTTTKTRKRRAPKHGHGVTRVKILDIVTAQGPVRNPAIQQAVGLTASPVKRHLEILQADGLIRKDVEGWVRT